MSDEDIVIDIGFIDPDNPRHAMIVYIIMIIISLFQGVSFAMIVACIIFGKSMMTIISLLTFNLLALACHYIAINILKNMLDGAVKTNEDNAVASVIKG